MFSLWLALFLSNPRSQAATLVFLEMFHQGQRLELEPKGQHAHVAIAVHRRWLHAHSWVGGVELAEDIERFGRNPLYLVNEKWPDPRLADIEHYLDKELSRDLEWFPDDQKTTYSARLVGEILGISPLPAHYMAPVWNGHVSKSGVGLSPDDIRDIALKKLKFRPREACEFLFN